MAAKKSREPELKYNVILISFDTLRRDFVHAYGYRKRLTPTIDRLARRGVRFADAFVNSGWTLPQHQTLITGCDSIHHEVVNLGWNKGLSRDIPTLAEIFFENRYVCAGIGNMNGYACGWNNGYHRGMKHYTTIFPGNNMMERVVPTATELLRQLRNVPFFLYFHTNDTHEPFAPSEPYLTKYGKSYVNKYEGQINYADHYLGEILGELKRLGLEKRTLIVFSGDHGSEFKEHGFQEKKLNLYEEIVEIPLIMSLAGALPMNKEVAGFVQTADVAPTILDICSIPIPKTMDGRSLVPQIRGRKKDVPEVIFCHTQHEIYYFYEHFCARTKQYKFIRTVPMLSDPTQLSWADAGERFKRLRRTARVRSGVWRELYDLKADPKEQKNIIDKEPDVAKDLEKQLNQWIRRHKYKTRKPPKGNVTAADLAPKTDNRPLRKKWR